MAEKKLEKQHVTEIEQLRTKFSENNTEIALATKEIYAMQQRVEQLESYQEQLLQQFQTLQSQETDLVNKLKEHYGEGQIDLEKGVFISES
jgi:predicted transcriptional regulator